jgi:ABC-2 type transport system ATP-binding protein
MSAITVTDLGKTYVVPEREGGLRAALAALVRRRTRAVEAVSGVSFTVEPGEIVGFLGPNGAGKTTTLKMLAGLLHPTAGTASVLGFTPWRRDRDYLGRMSLIMGQRNQLHWDIPVLDSFRLNQAIFRIPPAEFRARLDELVALLELDDLLRKPVRNLSLGERMKCEIAGSLLHAPAVLFLDEPTIGLDVQNRRAIWQHLGRLRSEEGTTLLLTTHHLEEAAGCDRVAFMSRGRLIGQGSPNELVGALGEYVLEVETESPAETASHLRPRFGEPLVEGERLLFRVAGGAMSLDHLTHELRAHARAIRLRRPDLNDVYLWIHRDPPNCGPEGHPEIAAGAS